MTNTIYLTQQGLDELKSELKQLTEVKRTEIAQRIKNAREMGDLSENAEYQAAKEEQAMIEGKIAELEDIVKHAKVSNGSENGAIGVGSQVVVHLDGKEQEFHLVGAPEADPSKGKISHESPIGSQLMGKKVGDKFVVELPLGTFNYTILKIK